MSDETTYGFEVDIFDKEHEFEYVGAVIDSAQAYSKSIELIEKYERSQEGIVAVVDGMSITMGDEEDQQIAEVDSMIGSLSDKVGKDLLRNIFGDDDTLSELIERNVTRSEYEEAQKDRLANAHRLIWLTEGFQQHLAEGMSKYYGDSEDDIAEIEEMSWSNAWTRLRETLKPVGGVVLADVADLFDYFVQAELGQKYRPADNYRGVDPASNPKLKAFYEVMQSHLNRAITSQNEDGWTGQTG